MGISGARQKRIATQYGIASGGTETNITVSGVSYKLHTFTSDGNFVVSTGGWFDVLLVGGGNAGYAWAGGAGYAGGGGGAGGVFQQTVYLPPATHSVDVGAGASGSAGNIRGSQGFPSVIGTGINAVSAAGGITFFPDNGATGTVGGELGSSGGCHNSASSSATNNVQGNKGGASTGINNGGGGGGFGAAGSAGSSTTGGAGGAGYDVSTFIGAGSSLFKAAGGGGGGSGAGGAGGSSIGGAGVTSGTGTAAGANTGSGGGGSTNTGTGGAGGSGIVYIRRRIEGDALSTTQGYGVATGGTGPTSIVDSGVTYNLLTFTSDGTLTVTTPGFFDVLVVGAGGAGQTAGGGGGGIVQTTAYFSSNQTVTIGAGISRAGQVGNPSRVGNIIAFGGGSNVQVGGFYAVWGNGGSGSGGSAAYDPTAGSSLFGQGNAGGAGSTASNGSGGGGGGAGAVGGAAGTNIGGNGGAGLDISAFLGQSPGTTYKSGGGGGGASATGGNGSIGGGGAGAAGSAAATAGTANSGGGSGGYYLGAAAASGSGIVYVRFRTA